MMEAAKVAEFAQLSGANPALAKQLLHNQQFDYNRALLAYESLQNRNQLKVAQSSRRAMAQAPPTLPSRPLPQLRHAPSPNNLKQPQYSALNYPPEATKLNNKPSINVKSYPGQLSPGVYREAPYGDDGSDLVISHGKSDSVDSSDGLRRTRDGNSRDERPHEYRVPSNVPSSSANILNSNQLYLESERNTRRGNVPMQRIQDDSIDMLPPPPPPPRAYRLIRDNGGSILIPASSPQTSAILLERMRHQALENSNRGPPAVPPHGVTFEGGERYVGRDPTPQVPPRRAGRSSTPGSRYGSTTSINHPAVSSGELVDYRAKLSSVRATLGDEGNSSLHFEDRRPGSVSYLNKWSQNNLERTGSVMSMKEGNSSLSRSASSAAKNALLREKVLGGRKLSASVTRRAPSSASPSPVMSRNFRGKSEEISGRSLAERSASLYEDNVNTKPSVPTLKDRSSSFENETEIRSDGNPADQTSPSKVAMLVGSYNAAVESQQQHLRRQSQKSRKGSSRSRTSSPNVTGKSQKSLENLAEQEARELFSSSSRRRSRHGVDTPDLANFTEIRKPFAPPPSAASGLGEPMSNLDSQCEPLNPYIPTPPTSVTDTHPPRRSRPASVQARPSSALNPDVRSGSPSSAPPSGGPVDQLSRRTSELSIHRKSLHGEDTKSKEEPPTDHGKLDRNIHPKTEDGFEVTEEKPAENVDSGLGSGSTSSLTPCGPAGDDPVDSSANRHDVGAGSLDSNTTPERNVDLYRKLNRGFSKGSDNSAVVCKARNELTQGLWDALDRGVKDSDMETPVHTFMLPDLYVYEAKFRDFVEHDLIELSTLHSLETSGRLNWWCGPCRKLWPLATTGDGNCLLHAASLGMWGFHDRLLSLRSALHDFLTTSEYSAALWRRWRYHTAVANAATGLVFSDEEWAAEWANVLRLSSTAPRNNNGSSNNNNNGSCNNNNNSAAGSPVSPPAGGEHSLGGRMSSPNTMSRRASGPGSKRLSNGLDESNGSSSSSAGAVYESLEEIHIFALAHVLKRPIIVVADLTLKDVHGAPLSPIPFGGVYLPLQHDSAHCQASPLLLTYDAAHFSALVVMEDTSDHPPPAVIPLTTNQHQLLPLHFAVDPGKDWSPSWASGEEPDPTDQLLLTDAQKLELLDTYLNVVKVPISKDFNDYHDFEYEPPERGYSPAPYAGGKKSSESSGESDDPSCTCDHGSHLTAPGQGSKTCPRHASKFETLSRSVSKKFKSLKKIGRPSSFRKKDDGDGMSARKKRMGGSLRRRPSSRRPYSSQDYILAAAIHTEKRMAYQEKMVNNYLMNARRRYQQMQENKKRSHEIEDTRKNVSQTGAVKLSPGGSKNGVYRKTGVPQSDITDGRNGEESSVSCINAGCEKAATASTAYLCLACYARQKDGEMELDRRKRSDDSSPRDNSEDLSPDGNRPGEASSDVVVSTPRPPSLDGPQYGAGRSQFYADLSPDSANKAATMPSSVSPSSSHPSALFLSNSTFYSGSSKPNSNSNKESVPAKGPGGLPPPGGKPRPGKRDQSSSRHDSNSSGTDQNSRPSEESIPINKVPQNNNRTSQATDPRQSRTRGPVNNNAKNTINKQPIKITERKAHVEGTGSGAPTTCKKRGCEFFGSDIFDGYCSKCGSA